MIIHTIFLGKRDMRIIIYCIKRYMLIHLTSQPYIFIIKYQFYLSVDFGTEFSIHYWLIVNSTRFCCSMNYYNPR